jgi:acyl-CoA synthetase (AMP-forming)/AMP-acid ligase II
MNIAARLAERAGRHPARTAIVEGAGPSARRLTFGALDGRVRALSAGLAARGIGPGDAVLLFIPMSADLYVALLACLHRGTAVFVDAWADRRRLDAAVRIARPRAFIGTPKAHLLRLLSPAVRAIPIHLAADRRLLPLRRHESAAPAGEAVRVDDDAPALVTFTTGSTGAPKAAARSHGFLWAQHLALANHLRPAEGDVDMPTLPVFVLNNLASGVTSVLPDFDPRRPADIRPERIHRQLRKERVTTSSGSPAFYARLCGWCERTGQRLPLRALFTGGAPVLPPLARLMASVVEGEANVVYGSSEAEPIAGIGARELLSALDAARGDADHPGGICVGAPVPEVEVRRVRPHDGPVALDAGGWAAWEAAPGEVGEVVVAGAHVLAGYLNDPEAERMNKIRDGGRVWHRTGDAAWMDDAGRLWLMGRIKERVLRDGRVWWGGAAEVRALEVPAVRHAAWLGVADADRGQRAVLCVETEDGRLTDDLRRALVDALGSFPVDEIRAVRRIPRDPRHASKTDMAALRALLG